MTEAIPNPKQSAAPRGHIVRGVLCAIFALWFAWIAHGIASAASTGLIAIANLLGLGRLFGNIVDFADLLASLILVFLLLVGFWCMARLFNKHRRPIVMMGLYARDGWLREWGMGAALGWAMVVLAVLPMAVVGALHYSFALTPGTIVLFSINIAVLALATLAEELIYRGYPFQRFIESLGTTGAVILMAAIYAAIHWHDAYTASFSHTLVLILGSVLLSLAYLRTRALWLVWGLHFAWVFSEGALFGLNVAGYGRWSTVVQADTIGPLWLTGGDFGLEASQVLVFALLAAIIALILITRDLNWKYNPLILEPGGIPTEIAPPAAHTEMENAAAARPTLVQILPTMNAPATTPAMAASAEPGVEQTLAPESPKHPE